MNPPPNTPLPWSLAVRYPGRIISVQSRRVVAYSTLPYNADTPTEEELANAHRIVACVNACAGLDNQSLERIGRNGAVGEILRRNQELERAVSDCWRVLNDMGDYEVALPFSIAERAVSALKAAKSALDQNSTYEQAKEETNPDALRCPAPPR